MKKILELSDNKRVIRKYTISKTYECGLVLNTTLLKAILNHHTSLAGSYGWVINNEIFLRNFGVNAETTNIKLLLTKAEIQKIIKVMNEKKHSFIPVRLYLRNHKVKIEMAISKFDKNFTDKEKINKLKIKAWKEAKMDF